MIQIQLSYEETMQRIDEYEKHREKEWQDYPHLCREVKSPYDIEIYAGENQIIVVPLITTFAYYQTRMAWFRQIRDINNAELIGNTVLEALDHIRTSYVDVRTNAERAAEDFRTSVTSCKSYISLKNKYDLCAFRLYDNGNALVCLCRKINVNLKYNFERKTIYLSNGYSAEEIGEAVIKCLA